MATNKNQEREAREARERLKRYNARQAVHTQQVSRRRRDNIIAIVGVLVIAALAAVTQIFYFSAGPGMPTAEPSASASATPSATPAAEPTANVGDVPSTDVAEDRTWTGDITLNSTKLAISLDGAAAPQAVASFVQSTKDGYYTDKVCHRLVDDDTAGLIQCGAVDTTGATDSDYSYGPIENAPTDGIYKAGTIAIARTSSAYGNGHQFFIVYKDTTLPGDDAGGYSVIGTVTSGLDDLTKDITDAGLTPVNGDTDGTPVTPTTITSVTVE